MRECARILKYAVVNKQKLTLGRHNGAAVLREEDCVKVRPCVLPCVCRAGVSLLGAFVFTRVRTLLCAIPGSSIASVRAR